MTAPHGLSVAAPLRGIELGQGLGLAGSGDQVILRDLLLTMERELASLQDLSTDAQLVMSFALQQASLDAGQWSRAQSLDLITQRLQGLATFVSALAATVPERWTVDAAKTVRDVSLSDLVRRILCAPPDLVAPDDEIELF